jgi:hypothetical protein
MKLLFTISIFLIAITSTYSQSLGYQDLGILFSQNDEIGSARFTGMSGAFGALGGDISSININPAGIAIFNNSAFSGTFNSRNSAITANYYENSTTNKDQFLNLSQAGGVLVFKNILDSEWEKFAFGFNYRITKDFSEDIYARGNSGVATFTNFPLDNNDPAFEYNIAEEQIFSTNYNGKLSEFNIAMSAVYQRKMHLGLSFNFYELNFSQQSQLTEFNTDGNGNNLDANLYQENYTNGAGASFNVGFIYKARANFRFGMAYQSPTWFTEIIETTNITDNEGYFGDTEITVSNENSIYDNTAGGFFPSQEVLYRLKTPSKLTASAAFIFGKNGLLSLDYMIRNYQNMKLSNDNFAQENQFFQNQLRNTHSYNIGSEWRFDKLSLRGGYKFEQNPSKASNGLNNLKGHSLGAGYHFGSFKLDFSYNNSNQNSAYNFYSGYNVNPSELEIDNRTFTTTITLLL